MQVSESAASTPSSTLKQLRTKTKGETSSSGLTTEERNRLTTTLEEIERERLEEGGWLGGQEDGCS